MKNTHSQAGRDPKKRTLTDVPQFSDRPPVAPARVAAMKARYKQAWLWFLFAVSMMIAWGIPIRYAVTRYLMFRRADPGPRVAEAFVTLAYGGISSTPPDIAPERFREHLTALRRAGYNPITLNDVHAFYEEGTLLPRRAVLMTFDQSRKSSYFDARSVLARAGWPAVMFLWTYPIQTEDPAALRWPYIRSMVRSGAWEAGAQGHRAFERIPADSEGTRRNYMAAPRWRPDEMRHETPEEFSRRLEADHEFTRALIRKEAGITPRAFAFPYGDFGQYDARALLSRRLNMDLVSVFYDLGFVHGASALNTRHSDPRRLNRLLVQAEWTGAELVERLEHSWPRETGLANEESLGSPLAWIREWGGFGQRDASVRLFAKPDATGARAWINGSDLFQDFTARFRFRIEDGQAGFFFRASPDGESYIYLVLGRDGAVWLSQKHAGLQPFTLGSARFTPDADGFVDLEVNLRGRLFFAGIRGRPVFSDTITVRGDLRPGMLGASIWDPTSGRAQIEFSSFEVSPFRTTVLTWPPEVSHAPALAAWLERNAVRFSHLAPPWLHIASRTQSRHVGWDADFFRSMARLYSMKWTPEISFETMETFEAALPEHLANVAADLGADGLYFNLGDMAESPSLARLTAWIQAMGQALDRRDMSFIVRLPEGIERESTIAALFQNLPNLQVSVHRDPPSYFRDSPEEARRIVSQTRADVPDEPVPLFGLLEGGDTAFETWDTEVRSAVLSREGDHAFRAGRWEQALNIYRRWAELEPGNEVPPRLMGDVYFRQADFGKALGKYRESLEQNPGQIPLVIEIVRLLSRDKDAHKEAASLLDIYARLFPENRELLIAQTEFYIEQNKPSEALRLVRGVVEEHPDDLIARGLFQRLLPPSKERLRNMRAILDIGKRPGVAPYFAEAIRTHDLLTQRESWMLMPFIEEQAAREKETGEPGLFQALAPRETVVEESFRLGQLSDHWSASPSPHRIVDGAFVLRSDPITTEAVLRLANSVAMHSGFIETTIEEVRGFFWIYARRSEGNMVRFGFEEGGRMHLQVWQNGRMLTNQTRPWQLPRDVFRLRLEIRGDAAFGFIDGNPAYGAPVQLPEDMGLGWWGLSPWSPVYGAAQASLRDIAAGPAPVTLALFWPRPHPWTDAEMMDRLGEYTQTLHAAAPPWYVHEAGGRIRPEYRGDFRDLRAWTRFYRIRLLPVIRSVMLPTLDLEDLVRLAKEERVDGFTLLVPYLPDEEWFFQAEQKLAESNLSLQVMRTSRQEGVAEIREVGPRIGLFPGKRSPRRVRLLPMDETRPTLPAPEPDPDLPDIETHPLPDRVLMF